MSAPPISTRSGLAWVTTVLVIFLVLGMPDGMIGAAWPDMRLSLDVPLSALSLVIACTASGFFLATLTNGTALAMIGARRLVGASLLTAATASVTIASSPALPMTLVAAFLLGTCCGYIDASVSTIVALSGNARLMGFMHGALSAGAAVSPLVVAVAAVSTSWRWAYIVLATSQIVILGAWLRTTRTARRGSRPTIEAVTSVPSARGAGRRERRGQRSLSARVWVGLLAFLFVSGLGVGTGAWGGVYLTDVLDLSAPAVGGCLSLYWASVSLSRLGVGLLPMVPPGWWLVGGSMIAVLGAALTLSHNPVVAVLGLVLIGSGSGPLFPVLSSLTPARVGRDQSGHVIGWQLAAAGIGAASLPSLQGFAVGRGGPAMIGPGLLVCAALACVFTFAAYRGTDPEPS